MSIENGGHGHPGADTPIATFLFFESGLEYIRKHPGLQLRRCANNQWAAYGKTQAPSIIFRAPIREVPTSPPSSGFYADDEIWEAPWESPRDASIISESEVESGSNYHRSNEEGWFYSDDDDEV